MADNLIQVGAVVDLGQYKAGMQEAVATTERSTQQMSATFVQHSARSREAIGGIRLAFDSAGGTINRHVARWLADMPAVGAAFSAAFPIFALAVFGEEIIKVAAKLVKWREEAEKLADDQTKFGTTINQTFSSLHDKLLQTGIKIDELNNNHLAALKKQLQLINSQSMKELVGSFEAIKKAVDAVFADLESNWHSFGIGSAGAKHALDQFQTQYNSLLAQGKDTEATNLLSGTLTAAQKTLEALKFITAYRSTGGTINPETIDKFAASMEALQSAGLSGSEKELKAQQALVDALRDQVKVQGMVADLNKANKHIAILQEEKASTIDLSNVVRQSHSKLTDDLKKQTEEAAKAEKEAIKGLGEYWKHVFEENREVADLRYTGEIESVKGAEKEKEQLIEQSFLRGKINQQEEIRQIAQAKVTELQAEIQYLKAKEILWAGDAKKIQEIENEITKIVRQQATIRTTAVTEGIKAQDHQWKAYFQQLSTNFNSSLNSWITGTETASQAFARMFSSILTDLLGFVEKWIEKKIEMWLMDEILGRSANLTTAAHAASLGLAQVEIDANVAAANAYAAYAAFPPVAAAMAAAAASAVQAFAGGITAATGIAAFERGGLVPQTGLALVHQGEKILPASMSGDGSGLSGHKFVFAPTIQAMDAEGVDRVLTKHQRLFEMRVDKVLRKRGLGGK